MKICMLTYIYPNSRFPEWGIFVEKHVREWEAMDLKVDVIAPKSIIRTMSLLLKRKHRLKIAGNRIERPIFISFPGIKIGSRSFLSLTSKSLMAAFIRGLKVAVVPDIYIGKFLFPGGWVAAKAKSIYKRRAYVDLGESDSLLEMQQDDITKARRIFEVLDGVFCVSPRLVHEAIALGAKPENVVYIPNTVNSKRFKPMNKDACRKKLGLPKDKFLVIFVGHFIERKGPLRVLQAIDSLSIPVKGIFLGQGPQEPKSKNVIHCGSVPNEDLPIWLNSADIFVLPTLAEGNCNAINEAMACGIPVISSNIADIKSQVPDDAGVLIEPADPDQIANAITKLYSNTELLSSFSLNCIKHAQARNEKSRARQMIDWIVQNYPELAV